ncbi:MAG: phosphogluconate dehydrogenase (NAD(+)-dependent, decarboxylating) [Nanoarchaeota archaeon]
MGKKRVGIVGLGKMGKNMALNLISKKYHVTVYNRSPESTREMARKGAIGKYSFEEFADSLGNRKIIILMVTAGKPVDDIIAGLFPFLSEGDIIIDGGNSFYEDSSRRYEVLKEEGINFIDLGVSGGLEGAKNGASLTIGGDKNIFKKIEFLFRDLAEKNGYGYVGNSGAGHFVKLIHNGIEYAILEAYGEGFEVLSKSEYKFNLKEIAKIWNNGSIIKSNLTELIEKILNKNPELKNTDGIIRGGESGKLAHSIAKKSGVEFDSLKLALRKRKLSEKKQSFSTRLISLLREEFGGHATKEK